MHLNSCSAGNRFGERRPYLRKRRIQAFEDEMVLLFSMQTHTHIHTHTLTCTDIYIHVYIHMYIHIDIRTLSFKILRENDLLSRSLCSSKLTICAKENKKHFQTKNWENCFPVPPFLRKLLQEILQQNKKANSEIKRCGLKQQGLQPWTVWEALVGTWNRMWGARLSGGGSPGEIGGKRKLGQTLGELKADDVELQKTLSPTLENSNS